MTTSGWRSRGYLPHFDHQGIIQFVTFRLWDSLPAQVVESLSTDEETMSASEKRQSIESYLDAGHGACYLQDPRIGRLVENSLLYFDTRRYRLFAWVIMPNHVHAVAEMFDAFPLDNVLHSWKSYTATEANKALGRKGKFWMREYFDRYIRNATHFARTIYYIHENPVAAGLVSQAVDWPFSSARYEVDCL